MAFAASSAIARNRSSSTTSLRSTIRPLPDCVQREFEDCLKCWRLEHGYCA